ncbi:MAG: twin-arginine translocation signal domain-containing protein, partial [Thioalkalispiraceae bacterium]
MQRRTFLKGSLAGSAVAVAVGAGLLSPRAVLAAWPKSA